MNGGLSNASFSQTNRKFVSTYEKLLQGLTPEQISPKESLDGFFANLFALDVERGYLEQRIKQLSKEQCLGPLKGSLNTLFSQCLSFARAKSPHSGNALDTLLVLLKCILVKVSTGWEIMEILAGGVSESDKVFMEFAEVIDIGLSDAEFPADIRHQILQVAIVFLCGVGQMSPGAYLLRRDLYASIIKFIKSPETEKFTFEATVFLGLLANYHKSDAAKLNPYLQRIRECTDVDLMYQICWASNFALDTSVKAYQAISDDSPPTFASSLSSMMLSLRPDRALASKDIDPPRELFKNQPIEATVVLLPLFELARTNQQFCSILMDYLTSTSTSRKPTKPIYGNPPPLTILTLSSYLLTHASSTSSSRAMALYNNQSGFVASITIRICHRIIWFLQNEQFRLDYHWRELWKAILALLDFLSAKLESLVTTGGIEQLTRDALDLLYLALYRVDVFLPTPQAVHEMIYEIARSSSILRKQTTLLSSLALPASAGQRRGSIGAPVDSLAVVISVAEYYEGRIQTAGARSAREGIQIVAREIDKEGLQAVEGMKEKANIEEPASDPKDVLAFGRYACSDALRLMP
ncbi:hypothetical protein HGRIS_008226 [Hohenbuehelia grisea]|uniref:Armadillo-like helical domain-containing protein n=1 Tax=Hohenbuehelia grisea TaxID=104357 RepID=A0ABR3J7R8_9AGAR